ncbi:MAG: fimbrillin family protein [Bacteroidaceae bacterium]|nr:fimbrillin family protein [Bacteroidaceae bacterium]
MKKLLTLAALAAVAASCTQSEVEDVKQSNEYIGIASATVNNMVLTRAGEGTTPLNSGSLGLFVNTDGDDIFKVDNMKWSYAEETGWTSISNLAYEGDGKQTAYAYHPYRPEAATTSFNFTINDERTDLLWWKSEGQLTSKTLNIDFRHALSKLTINLKKNEEVAGDDLGQVTISGTKKNGIADLTSQTWNTEDGEIADITTGESGVALTEGFDKTVWSTLIPQTVTITVSVEVGSKTYTWTGAEQEFLPGYAYTLNLTVGREVAAIGEVNVTDWTLEETPEEGNADYAPNYLTGEKLRTYMDEQLAAGQTDITVALKPTAGYADFYIIRQALKDADIEDGSINLTITGAVTVPGDVFRYNEDDGTVPELNSVTLPNVLEIGDWAFGACINLTNINAPNIITIGSRAFNDCKVTEISFPMVKTIGRDAFTGCSELTSISLPELLKIDAETFRHTKIENLYLPKVTFIEP